MKFLRIYFSLMVLLLLAAGVQGQNKDLEKANQYFYEFAYPEAIKYYQKVLKDVPSNSRALLGLGDAYFALKDFEHAGNMYGRALELDAGDFITEFKYGQCLMVQEKYEEARKWFLRYATLVPQDPRGKAFAEACAQIDAFYADSSSYEVRSLPINTEVADFGPAYYGRGIVFASSRGLGNTYSWDNMPFLDLYYVEVEDSGRKFSRPKVLKGQLNTRYHEANASFDQRNRLVYFTRNNYLKGKKKQDREGTVHLQIFYADYEGGAWKNVRSLPFNDLNFSVGHPSISADGQSLYFTSDMPGGFGGTDIYVTTRKGDTWSTPINLGETINTPGNEMFPFFHADGTLYFASDGHGGLGGLDIFETELDEEGAWKKPENPGYPMNSPHDDFGMVINPSKKSGYFSSNRPGGAGKDDIYRFTLLRPTITGRIVSSENGKALDYARITLKDRETEEEKIIYATGTGSFSASIRGDKKYFLLIEKPGFESKEIPLSTMGVSGRKTLEYEIKLDPPPLQAEIILLSQKTKAPLRKATIFVMNDGRKLTTDESGKARLFLDPDSTYVFDLSGEGHKDLRTPYVPNRRSGLEEVKFFLEPVEARVMVSGRVFNRNSEIPIKEVDIRLVELSTGEERNFRSEPDGHFSFSVPRDKKFNLFGEKTGYITAKLELSTENQVANTILEANLGLEAVQIGMSFTLNNIYYNQGESEIRRDARQELDKLANFLKDNSTLRIELSSHTDSRGGDRSNLLLSQKRADAAARYLISRGIETNRIVATGYGEQQLLNACANGVKCSEAQHEQNRRTEFKVIGYTDPVFSEALKVDEKTGKTYQDQKGPEGNNRSEKLPAGFGQEDPKTEAGEGLADKAPDNKEPKQDSKQEPKPNPVKTLAKEGEAFSIQIGIFRDPASPEYLSRLGEFKNQLIIEEKGDMVRYRVGNKNNYEDAVKTLVKIQKKGYLDAFIVSVKPGELDKVKDKGVQITVIELPGEEDNEEDNTEVEMHEEDPGLSLEVEGLVYKVQIGVFSQQPPRSFFSRLGTYRSQLLVEMIGNAKKYSVGTFPNYQQAGLALEELKNQGFKDAFTLALYLNKRITVEEALQMEKEKGR